MNWIGRQQFDYVYFSQNLFRRAIGKSSQQLCRIKSYVVIPFNQPAKRPDYGTYQLLHLGHETKERGNGSWQRKRGIHWGRS